MVKRKQKKRASLKDHEFFDLWAFRGSCVKRVSGESE